MSDKEKVRHVEAEFGGEEVRFELVERLVGGESTLEIALGGGRRPMSLLNAFIAGQWSNGDLHAVLHAALPAERRNDFHFVSSVISGAPPAPLAMLAGKILEAYLFGLADEGPTEGVAS